MDTVLRLALVGLLVPLPGASSSSDKHTVRVGDLLIEAVSVEQADSQPDHPVGAVRARNDHRFVVVQLRIKNVGRRPVCAEFVARLKASQGMEYRREVWFIDNDPLIHEMLQGEEARGSYTFRVKKGIAPLELILEPSGGCRNAREGGGFIGHRPARIRLEGLLNPVKP